MSEHTFRDTLFGLLRDKELWACIVWAGLLFVSVVAVVGLVSWLFTP